MENIYNILVRPMVTEKSMQAQGSGKYTFMVGAKATKVDIANAVQTLYKTTVTAVNVTAIRKKVRFIGRTKWHTKRQAGRKAVVTLKKGETIDIMKIAA